MRNIINIIKYNLNSQKTSLIIEAGIIIFFIFIASVSANWFFTEGVMIPLISIILTVNLITGIVNFSKCIVANEGRLLFSAPIKGWQFIVAKYLEFILIQVVAIALVMLGTLISGKAPSLVLVVGASVFFGMMTLYIMITSFIVMIASYFNKTFLCIIFTVVLMVIYGLIVGLLELGALILLPYVYLEIGNVITISVFGTLINIFSFVGIVALAIYHLDNKLDIV